MKWFTVPALLLSVVLTPSCGSNLTVEKTVSEVMLAPSLAAYLQGKGYVAGKTSVLWVTETTEGEASREILKITDMNTNASVRLTVKQHPEYFTRYQLFMENGAEAGFFSRFDDNGFITYRIDNLCDVSYTSAYDWSSACRLSVQNGALRL